MKSIFLNRVVIRTLDRIDTGVSIKTYIRKRLNARDKVVAKFDRLIIGDRVITKATNRINTADNNEMGMIK